ncbi:MAG: glycosyl hydrolase [Treponema sp.]|nr:glycosyl hydrolase [Treponema sp.]
MKRLISLKRYFAGFAVVAFAAVALSVALVSCETAVENEPGPPVNGGEPEPPPPPPPDITERPIKRGVGYSFNNPSDGSATEADVALLAPGIRWFYNWSSNISQRHVRDAVIEHGLVFIPQLWNASWTPATVAANLQSLIDEGHNIRYIMTYNEPMLTVEANMTPAQAAADWPRVLELARQFDLKVVSPAMTFGNLPGFGHPVEWLREFLAQPGVYIEDMHAIRIHTYMSHTSAVRWYVGLFEEFGLPIWVTEFSAWYYVPGGPYGSSPSGGQAEGIQFQMNFMSEVVTFFELNPMIEKYFWFHPKSGYVGVMNDRHPFHNLLYDFPPRLTPLGVVYVNMPHFLANRYDWVPVGLRMTAGEMTNANTFVRVSADYVGRFVRFRPSTDTATDRAVLDVHHFIEDRWVEYQVEIPAAGTSTLIIRNMAPLATILDVYVDGSRFTTLNLAQSSAWQTSVFPFELPAGRYTIRLVARSGNFAFNWLELN